MRQTRTTLVKISRYDITLLLNKDSAMSPPMFNFYEK